VVEQNRDAQLRSLLKLDLPPDLIGRLRSVLHYNGLPIDARSVTDEILVQEGKKAREAVRKTVIASITAGGE
jgi:2-oxoglutarate ferredoxin oxidoreductase subunit alpha